MPQLKTNKWFYELFLSQPGMLAELIPALDADWQFSYSATVIKEKAQLQQEQVERQRLVDRLKTLGVDL